MVSHAYGYYTNTWHLLVWLWWLTWYMQGFEPINFFVGLTAGQLLNKALTERSMDTFVQVKCCTKFISFSENGLFKKIKINNNPSPFWLFWTLSVWKISQEEGVAVSTHRHSGIVGIVVPFKTPWSHFHRSPFPPLSKPPTSLTPPPPKSHATPSTPNAHTHTLVPLQSCHIILSHTRRIIIRPCTEFPDNVCSLFSVLIPYRMHRSRGTSTDLGRLSGEHR